VERVYIVMGVTGSGKSTFGKLLADRLMIPFYDGDDYHPASNIIKMSKGNPLTDEDREPWLKILSVQIKDWANSGGAVLACSSLKKSYRKILNGSSKAVFIYLAASKDLIQNRLENRKGHFMPSELINSQFKALEEPVNAIKIDASFSTNENINHVIKQLSHE